MKIQCSSHCSAEKWNSYSLKRRGTPLLRMYTAVVVCRQRQYLYLVLPRYISTHFDHVTKKTGNIKFLAQAYARPRFCGHVLHGLGSVKPGFGQMSSWPDLGPQQKVAMSHSLRLHFFEWDRTIQKRPHPFQHSTGAESTFVMFPFQG